MSTLNEGQQAAADGFFTFLFGDQSELNISGPGGVGKTFLMSHMIDQILPAYFDICKMQGIPAEFDEVVMTATTNKAAEVLAVATQRPTSTIQSFLNLKVQDDYSTGQSRLTPTNGWRVHEKKIVFIDECSMIDRQLLEFIRKGTCNCKVIYVGDHCQLAPVMEPISPIYQQNLPFFELTEQMRNSGQPALMNVCNQLRHTVETGEFLPIQIVPGVIDHLDDGQLQEALDYYFKEQTTDVRILAYTNQRVMQYNDHIRTIRSLPEEYTLGEYLVNNSAIRLRDRMLSVEEEVTITNQGPQIPMFIDRDERGQDINLMVRETTILSRIGDVHTVLVPSDRSHFNALVDYYRKQKNWPKYYDLKNKYPDLRQRDAATVHKSQGSTYEAVFIDLGNISTCHQANAVARMLYVAFSRSRTRVFLYGKLAPKYGGLIH